MTEGVRKITELTGFFNVCPGIPDIKTEKVGRKADGDSVITVADISDRTFCHKCGRGIAEFHGYGRGTELRHPPIPGRKTYIRIRPERYGCPCCEGKPAAAMRVSRYDSGSPHTRAYEDHIMLSAVSSTVSDVSIGEDSGYEAATGMIGRRAGSGSDRDSLRHIRIVGTDANFP